MADHPLEEEKVFFLVAPIVLLFTRKIIVLGDSLWR